jgi:hypothetical protein
MELLWKSLIRITYRYSWKLLSSDTRSAHSAHHVRRGANNHNIRFFPSWPGALWPQYVICWQVVIFFSYRCLWRIETIFSECGKGGWCEVALDSKMCGRGHCLSTCRSNALNYRIPFVPNFLGNFIISQWVTRPDFWFSPSCSVQW